MLTVLVFRSAAEQISVIARSPLQLLRGQSINIHAIPSPYCTGCGVHLALRWPQAGHRDLPLELSGVHVQHAAPV